MNDLKVLIPRYQKNKTEMDSIKKLVDKDNKQIKENMLSEKLDSVTVDDITAKITISERAEFIEEALIEKVKNLKIKGIIKKKEYVDMAELENAIYDGRINAAELADCQNVKEIVTLRIKKGD